MEAKVKKARRYTSVAIILGAVATVAASAAACSSSDDDKGAGRPEPTIGAVANDPSTERPVDATPSPDGKDIYFIADGRVADEDNIGQVKMPGIYKVSAAGGPITKLASGAPLVAPFGITISDDGQTLFIADSAAQTSEDRSDGAVFSLSVGGGTPSELTGTQGLAPGGVEAAGDTLYITGRKDGQAGLFKTPLGGGSVSPVAVGGPFADPGGVAIAKNGDAFVVDTGGISLGQVNASVVKVTPDGHAEVVVDGLAVGHPAGIALTYDQAAIYVSGFDVEKGTDVVYSVDKTTKTVGLFTTQIADFADSAGLHRARNVDVFAWADGHANGTGTVYVLRGQ